MVLNGGAFHSLFAGLFTLTTGLMLVKMDLFKPARLPGLVYITVRVLQKERHSLYFYL